MDANTPFNSQDHDLLIEVNTNVKNLTSSLQAYTANTNVTSQDHEARLRVTETQLNVIKGSQRTMKSVGTTVSILLTIAMLVVAIISIGYK